MSEAARVRWDCPCRNIGEMYPESLFLGWDTTSKYVETEEKAQVLSDESAASETFVRMRHSPRCVAFRKLLNPNAPTSPIRLVYWAGSYLGSWWRWV